MAINQLYLVSAARLAFENANSPSAKAAAETLRTETIARYEALKNPALAAGAPFPTSVDQRRREWLTDLRMVSGDAFDRLFAKQRLIGDTETAALLQAYLTNGDGFYVKEYGAEELPRLKGMIAAVEAAELRSR